MTKLREDNYVPTEILSPRALGSTGALRRHPLVGPLLRKAEGRHLGEEELQEYRRQVPAFESRAAAAAEVAACEAQVVEKTVSDIFAIYAFEKHHALAAIKAPRDITNVSVYATHAMLMNDGEWFRDKLLLWLRTILQAFRFPVRETSAKKVLFAARPSSKDNSIEQMPQLTQAVHETYVVLKRNYQQVLSPVSYQLMEPYLQQAIDTLSAS